MGLSLSRALRLTPIPRVAFVGAGGKTTALFALARQLEPVIVCASTHLSLAQIKLADQHLILEKIEDCDQFDGLPLHGVNLVTGAIRGERTAGLSGDILTWLHAYCDQHGLPMLIEADGSRQRPLKAPASYEPVIPEFVDHVIVMVGLSGIGKPLTSEWVHRPEQFASLSELSHGELIVPDAVIRVLMHPEGGIRNIPIGALRIVMLNQADTPVLQALAGRMARSLLSTYDSVLSTSAALKKIYAAYEPTAGLILAAGEAKRFGEPKQLLVWRDKPLVWHAANSALEAGLSPVVVVSGAYTPQIQEALANLPVKVIHNPTWREGQSSSVKAGLDAIGNRAGAAVFLLSDQPQIPAILIRSLVQHHTQTMSPIIAPIIDGQRGNPVLFDRSLFPDLMSLEGDIGGRHLFSRQSIQWLPWHDDRLLLDVDKPNDYQQLLKMSF
ncbi:MAG: putative selenium-dependent hydroxylase accessory protein YqeC [Chloroflexi bacterium]|nr:putative selenium-dependent hydroxylase accessory protein YqeC [Chloroflexota bacterium]